MSERPQLWVLAGGNGAGKSTFYRERLQPLGIGFVNADLIAREIDPAMPAAASYAAAQEAMRRVAERIEARIPFAYETVASHPSKLDLMRRAADAGFEITLVYLHLADPGLNVARVAQRVAGGGHDVAADKIRSRLPRTLAHMSEAARLVDRTWLLDNSDARAPFALVAEGRPGAFTAHVTPLPTWAGRILAGDTTTDGSHP